MKQSGTVRILIADDHPIVRQGLRKILELELRFEVIDEVGDGQSAIRQSRSLQPDVILMDINMPGASGIEACQVIKREHPQIGIIILTAHDDEGDILRAVEAKVDGFLLKDVDPDRLSSAILCVAQGGSVLDPDIINKAAGYGRQRHGHGQDHRGDDLTEREKDVLSLIGRGASNQAIAQTLFISEKTVKNHITSIFRKIQVKDRTQAALFAIKHRFVDIQ
ncbi:response regulator transcription factor [Heliophilum fasciatum]|uniref:Stage 0 sporulation protein A homolog n=1 Tax=Heliophilum fasciatum TaxID=35700 RepID=A0A4R2RYA1_9FIRM|nr:response regulator transcription factor [Heliophilum fasciatum]MCW2278829.1 DNA-binding NarL/FixJ family response regulator [Heliophilum fasciatum]TCP64085.1 LuxR family two component transcriptional regulator [Heliophilum fasciatum]